MTSRRHRIHAGFTIVELLVAIALGLMILASLAGLFVNSSTNQRELQRSAQQIENGRYALDVLSQDLSVTGYLGPFRKYATPAALPDPCDVTTAALQTAIGLPVQGYSAGSTTSKPTPPVTCAKLVAANLAAGSDILVIRRADTSPVAIGAATPAGEVYLQSISAAAIVQAGGGTFDCANNVAGAPTTLTRRCVSPAASDACAAVCTGGGNPTAETRKLHVHIYFVAPCSVPAGGGDICTGAAGEDTIPTLKRLEVTNVGGVTNFQVVPIAEGVQYMNMEYGIDDTPVTPDQNTGLVGDGIPDRYSLAPNLADFANAVTVRVDLLVQNPEPSPGFTDAKTYNLGVDPIVPTNPAMTLGPFNDSYRRHVYSAEIRLVNLAGRKEIP